MRLLRLTTNYADYLAQFYAQHPDLPGKSYNDQYAALVADCFQWSDALTNALIPLGYEVTELIANVEPLQKQWAKENNAAYGDDNWLFDIASAQVRAFRPDVLFLYDYTTFTALFLRRLKSENPSIRLILGWCGAPYTDPSVFHEYDLVLSCIPELVEHFRANGHRAEHMHHAFNPEVLNRIDVAARPRFDFTFSGQIVMETQFHRMRQELIRALVSKTDLQVWAEFTRVPLARRLRLLQTRAAYNSVEFIRHIGVPEKLLNNIPLVKKVARWKSKPTIEWAVSPSICRRAHKPVFGRAMYQLLHDSRVTLNTHIDISPRSASNMRLYEATGVGACLLTDWKENLPELYEPEREVVTYRTAEECVEKVRYLLDHGHERNAIAAAGQARTLRNHTFTQRASQVDQIISAALISRV